MTRKADQLETRLGSLAQGAAYPATPDVVGAAVRRLQEGATLVPPPTRAPVGRTWRVLVLALLALLIAVAVAAAALFGLPDLRLGYTEVLPSPAVSQDAPAIRRWLGRPVDLAAAKAALGDELRIPAALGDPDEVHLGNGAWRDRVALVYHAEAGALAVADGLGLIVMEWRGGLDDRMGRKWLQDTGGRAELVDVDGARGYWVSGIPHAVEFLDAESGVTRSAARLVGDVLVWQDDAVVYRIESPLGRDATLDIARSMTGSSVSPPPTGR